MAEKSVIWSKRANVEFREILEFYTQRNGNSKFSLKILQKVNEIISLIQENENIGRLTENKKNESRRNGRLSYFL